MQAALIKSTKVTHKAWWEDGKHAHLSLACVVIGQASWIKHSLPKVPRLHYQGMIMILCASWRTGSANMHSCTAAGDKRCVLHVSMTLICVNVKCAMCHVKHATERPSASWRHNNKYEQTIA